ncbi:FAD-dependent monooxygenase [Algoriphagus jejuensis]|uniref:FAD-dependent monooxygenase n=1 Tax=Algoriphagus jejuensis TaxID=419934 RepID=A0ABN1N4J9_9BACT
MKEQFAIIGAGIGGLTLALTLKQKGHEVTIFESASEIKPVGAGIIMANNAMQVFRTLGMKEKIEKAGNKVSSMKITDEQLKAISSIELAKFEAKYGVYNVAIHRADLQRLLAEEIGLEHIQLSKRLSKIERIEGFNLTFDDNTTAKSRIVIGADGIHSTVRKEIFEVGEIRDTRQVCWRGVCEVELPKEYEHTAFEAWGKGLRFGFVKINSQKVYWYAVASEGLVPSGSVNLSGLFRTFHSDVLRIIAATPAETIFFSKITDLKPISIWQDKGACLIGDAAHATTPNMGQGACQAIEDAYAIGKLLESGKPMDQVFSEYERVRMKKAHQIVNTSWTMGKLAHLENGLGIWLRNAALGIVPSSLNDKQLDGVFDIGYIDSEVEKLKS